MAYDIDYYRMMRGLSQQQADMARIRGEQAMAAQQLTMQNTIGQLIGDTLAVGTTKPPDTQFKQLKQSVKKITAKPFNGEARRRIENKINRLQSAGATAQALILEQELQTRDSLMRLKEWDYKLLTKEIIKESLVEAFLVII